MASFDKNRCLNNIYFLVKEKNLRIGDLEAGAGVSIGYISRLNKDDSKATPSIEFLVSIADKLDVTIDALIQYDYTTPTASERYVMDFLDRLIQKTASFDLFWERESLKSLLYIDRDEYGAPLHPLFNNEVGEQGSDWNPRYTSHFHEEAIVEVSDDGYKLMMDGETHLHLMEVRVKTDDLPWGDIEYELYMVRNGAVEPLCHFEHGVEAPFNSRLLELYSAARETSKHIRLSDSAKSAIDRFMQDTKNDDDNGGDWPF